MALTRVRPHDDRSWNWYRLDGCGSEEARGRPGRWLSCHEGVKRSQTLSPEVTEVVERAPTKPRSDAEDETLAVCAGDYLLNGARCCRKGPHRGRAEANRKDNGKISDICNNWR